MSTVRIDHDGRVTVVTIDRPEVRNAVDRATADALAEAFRAFEEDADRDVGILTGAGGAFCAGADLKAISTGGGNRAAPDGDGPMGPTRMLLDKPVIACDLRVAARDALFGVYCRRWGVPLIDGGTVRLPRLIGHSRALDMILTGRGVSGDEALAMGLANRIAEPGAALEDALVLARELAALPQLCLRSDRLSSYEQWGLSLDDALSNEFARGAATIASGETLEGAARFAAGAGRHGAPASESAT